VGAFAGNRLQGAKRLKLGGRRSEVRGGRSPKSPNEKASGRLSIILRARDRHRRRRRPSPSLTEGRLREAARPGGRIGPGSAQPNAPASPTKSFSLCANVERWLRGFRISPKSIRRRPTALTRSTISTWVVLPEEMRQQRPRPSIFCTCDNPPIILSHWDTDHWAGAKKQNALHARTWIAPRQTISTSHVLHGNDILRAGGRMLVMGHGAPPVMWRGSAQHYDLRRCTGTGRNGSGLALVVTDQKSNRSWVLTGDAGYHLLAQSKPTDISAMVAPHHGADMGTSSVPFARSTDPYARLLYSFGPNNGHGPHKPPVRHPVAAAIISHTAASWVHGNWTPVAPAMSVAGGDVLATATHTTTHLQGTGATWTGGNPSLPHLASCPNALPVGQW
jgi:hypothetical protein